MDYESKLSLAKAQTLADGVSREEWKRWQTAVNLVLARIGLTPQRVHAATAQYWRCA